MAIHINSAPSARAAAWAEERRAAGLALIAGYVDAFGLIKYGTYVSFMSGNTTQTAFNLGEGHLWAATPALLAIASFATGVFAGTMIAHAGIRRARRLRFLLVVVLLASVVAVAGFGALLDGIGIALISLAMGIMNTTLSSVGAQSINLTFVTGTLSRMASHFALALERAPLPDAQGPWDTHKRRAFLLAGLWGGFLTGGILSGAATPHFGVWVLLPPLAALALLGIFADARAAEAGLQA